MAAQAATARRILVVDDEEPVRRVVCESLPGHEIDEATDAEDALDRMPAELVITDIHLPLMDGCALAARIRERWPHVPLLAISGYVDDRDVADFHFDGFLEKPLDLGRLREMVDRALTGPS
jgi:CheY-like chemotaxis protein